jgi:glucokinase
VLAQSGYVFGIDISAARETVVLADLRGNLVSRISGDALDNRAPDQVIQRVLRMMSALLKEKGVKSREVLRAAVGFGGPVDALHGKVLIHHDVPGWEGVPLAPLIESGFDVPTFLDNDSRLAALGEVWFGAGRDTSECDLVYLHWSTGVGGGIVADGRLLRGASTIAGEIGHTLVRTGDDALPCRCGGRGHLEAYVRGPALLSRSHSLPSASASDPADIQALFASADDNPAVSRLLDEAVQMLGATIANLITQLNPTMVVIGGMVARHGGSLIPRISDFALASAMPVSARNVRIVPAALGDDATVMGAVALALNSLR